jgi:hypothetical protein
LQPVVTDVEAPGTFTVAVPVGRCWRRPPSQGRRGSAVAAPSVVVVVEVVVEVCSLAVVADFSRSSPPH